MDMFSADIHGYIVSFSFSNGDMSLVTRKPVFGICDKVRLKPVCSNDETSKGLEISAIARLRGCAGRSAPLLFAYGINRFSPDVVHITNVYKYTVFISYLLK